MIHSVLLRKSNWVLDIVFTSVSFPSGADKTVSQPDSFIQVYLYSMLCSNFWGKKLYIYIYIFHLSNLPTSRPKRRQFSSAQ